MEDTIIAFKPVSMPLPFVIPNSNRLLDPTTPVNSTTNFYPVAPPLGLAAVAQITNVMTNYNWEYVWHCHLLGHEENDMMRSLSMVVNPPVAPTTLAAKGSVGTGPLSVVLTWADKSTNEASFTIQRATNTGFTANLKTFTVAANVATYTDADPALLGSTRYYYRVRATNGAGNSAWSNTVNLTTAVGPPPGAPTNLATGTITRSSIVLTWTSGGPNTASVTVQRATNATFTTGLVSTTVTGNPVTYTRTGLARNTTYYFRIQARNAGGVSAWTATVTAKTLP